ASRATRGTPTNLCWRCARTTTVYRSTRGATARASRPGAWPTCWKSTTWSSPASPGPP
ncbi:unnamed protein product, partial [Ectocarpus sp. 4 AP-2014]